MITDIIQKLVERTDLTEAEARGIMEEIMTGSATQAQMGAFLTALRLRPGGEPGRRPLHA